MNWHDNPHGLVLIEKGKHESGRFILTSSTREGLMKSLSQINLDDYPEPDHDYYYPPSCDAPF